MMYDDRTGLGAIELAVLRSLDEMGAPPDRPYRKSATVVQHVYDKHGIGPRHAYEMLCALAVPWHMNVPLVDFHGNCGSLDPADKPANARYTEVRLTRSGAYALSAARGDGPKLPILLLNGDMWNGGTAPPFACERVVEAVRRARRHDVSDEELIATVGPPSFPSRCDVDGDIDALLTGEPVQLRCSARAEIAGADIVITNLPPGIGPEVVGQAIVDRFAAEVGIRREYPELAERLELPLRDVRNESGLGDDRIVCAVRAGSDLEATRAKLLETWPLTVTKPARLPAPLATLLRHFTDDAAAQDPVLDALTR
jgi:DNA gyrase/topoisomerase IV subunit A